MIPEFNQHDVLPPFLAGTGPTDRTQTTPYQTTLSEIVQRFGISEQRRQILQGLIQYRQALRNAGFTEGFQWIDGSFIENCEKVRNKPPADIDIVSFLLRPQIVKNDEEFENFFHSDIAPLLDVKDKFKCDAYYVDLNAHPFLIVKSTHYWFGLFTHQRETYLWKGLLEVPLNSDDELAQQLLNEEVSNAS